MIKATGIIKTYVKGPIETTVLKGIDIHVEAGEFVSIMGKSGAGKSTLMYQLSLLDRPTAGAIFLNDVPVESLDETERTEFRLHNMGYIFQDYALIPELSSLENVSIPLIMRGIPTKEARIRSQEVLDKVGLGNKAQNLPSELSGGEQQRVSIARAIVGHPKILFADEPTANLDSISSGQVLEVLKRLSREGLTIVMVTHEHEYAVLTDRIIYLEDGRITREERLRS